MNPFDRYGLWLGRLTRTQPFVGWVLTILSAPVALAGSVALFAAVLVISPVVTVSGGVLVIILIGLAIAGRKNENYAIDNLSREAFTVIMILSCVIGICITIVTLLILYRPSMF
jgi:hypothetical protein